MSSLKFLQTVLWSGLFLSVGLRAMEWENAVIQQGGALSANMKNGDTKNAGADGDIFMLEKSEKVAVNYVAEPVSESFYKACKRLFMRRVEADIKNKALYTRALGLKISGEEKKLLTMELRPLTFLESMDHNYALLVLSIDPKNTTALSSLTELYQKRGNQAFNKAADALFPRVLVVDDVVLLPCSADYNVRTATVRIAKSFYTEEAALECAYNLLHEFTHHLQAITCTEMGGFDACRVIDKQYEDCLPEVGVEIEAEASSGEYHPELEAFVESKMLFYNGVRKMVAQNMLPGLTQQDTWGPVLTLEQVVAGIFTKFPYFSDVGHLVTLVRKKPAFYSSQPIAKYLNDKKFGPTLKAYVKGYDVEKYAPAIFKVHQTDQKTTKEVTAYMKGLIRRMYVGNEFDEKIQEASNFRYGSTEFFAIREKLGLLPK